MSEFDYWKLLAGLGIFMFGMQLLEISVKDLSGKAFRRIIRNYTNTRFKAIAGGTLVTAVLQSSSAVSLMVLAFVGAGVMSMENAIGVILGSNIGTTLTAWIVATLGFKVKIEVFALPFIGIAAFGLILFKSGSRPAHLTRLLVGFGFLFLGLDYMKISVEVFAKGFDPSHLHNLPLWGCLFIGTVMTALMQASAATIAITLAALNSGLMTFEMGAAMVIGANIGTTITILLGAAGGAPPKKRVAVAHLVFNFVTGITTFAGLPLMVRAVKLFVDVSTNGPVGLALFHSLFNITGVLLFVPFVSFFTRLLVKFLPEHRKNISVYLANTPAEETEAACLAMKNEVIHMLQESQLYALRTLALDEQLVFDDRLPFEKTERKPLTGKELFTQIGRLHSAVVAYYSRIQTQTMDESRTTDLDQIILASRNIMNAAKNFQEIRPILDEFEVSDSAFLNRQYGRFRKRLLNYLTETCTITAHQDPKLIHQTILATFKKIEADDNLFIQETVKASAEDASGDLDLSGLLLSNRLFTQASRMLIFSVKDLFLTPKQAQAFDKEITN